MLNVCGIKPKLGVPEFDDFLNRHDIISLCETKTDKTDEKLIKDYIEMLIFNVIFEDMC